MNELDEIVGKKIFIQLDSDIKFDELIGDGYEGNFATFNNLASLNKSLEVVNTEDNYTKVFYGEVQEAKYIPEELKYEKVFIIFVQPDDSDTCRIIEVETWYDTEILAKEIEQQLEELHPLFSYSIEHTYILYGKELEVAYYVYTEQGQGNSWNKKEEPKKTEVCAYDYE